ncbi:MAG: linear amide C-N hydrolase [Planctomycetia bacterium]|nr:linear amide C-N hydrolase [Planctomycetia bacterium]
MSRSRLLLACCVLCIAIQPASAEPFRYAEGKHGQGELKYINDVPVLRVAGKPADLGEQTAVLALKSSDRLLGYPREFLKLLKLDLAWPVIVGTGKGLLQNFPEHHLAEMEAGIQAGKLDRDLVVAANTMFDLKKVIGCSTLIIEPGRSATGGMLFGRNLDFPTLGYLHEYSLVTVYKPEGKKAFASVGFPGCIGVLTGMNEDGLTVAVLEVYSSNDDSLKFDAKGIPYAICFRRLLEECATVEEAEKLLKSLKRTTRVNLAIGDKKTAAVFEITPKSVVVRPSENGVLPCTNHFRSKELGVGVKCWRYPILEKSKEEKSLNVRDVAALLHEVNQGQLTLQTMVFEPADLKLHLAIGKPPTSALPLKTLDLGPLLKK